MENVFTIMALGLGVLYLLLVRKLRYQRYNRLHAKYAGKTLTPAEAQEIVQLAVAYDMPMVSECAVGFALFKTYAIPSISSLLLATRQLSSHENVSRRYADTAILIATWVACPMTGKLVDAPPDAPRNDPRAALAIARVNWLHQKYKISNEDYLYTLGLFMFEPAKWAERFGWREHSELEKHASFVYWSEIGRLMNIDDIPPTAEAFQVWIQEYEEKHVHPAECSRDVAVHTINEILFPVPTVLREFAEGFGRAMLDDRTRVAMMQPEAPAYAGIIVEAVFWALAFISRHLLLPRRHEAQMVQAELPEMSDGVAPRMFPRRWAARPWYKPVSGGRLGYWWDRMQVLLSWHEDAPCTKYRSEGTQGPLKFEDQGHEELSAPSPPPRPPCASLPVPPMDVDETEIRCVEDLWFDDGDLVLQAGTARYRVYRVVLSLHSPVFKDMLAFPQPPEDERVDGQPLVHLLDLEAEVTPFLKAIFEPEYFPSFPARTDFRTVYGCIRLGNKYGVDYLFKRGLVHLSSRFVTSLARWDAIDHGDYEQAYSRARLEARPASEIMSWPPPTDKSYLICVIALARECDATWILPNAFYDLTFHFDALQENIFHDVVFDGVIPAALNRKEQREWVVGFEDQISTTTDILRFLSHPPDIEHCLTPTHCPLVRYRAADYGRQVISDFSRGPLSAWAIEDWERLQGLCGVCVRALKRLHQEARKTFWEELPDIYHLPGWSELLRAKERAIGDAMV
ncbi:hypothetical protein MKEN_00014700 [Mycena kentingensis (nom. inval.)]|nr:hypothetical protein MKEN_00014700 [Mycena kentingensis (nom. inval.)]